MQGGEGNDFLDGGKGNDSLFGGLGIDKFYFGLENGQDTINDFDVATEIIQVAAEYGFANGSEILSTLSKPFSNVSQFNLSANDYIRVFHNVQSGTPLTAANFQIVSSSSTPVTLAISATNGNQTEGNAGAKAFTFTINRSGSTTGTNNVNWEVTGTGNNPVNANDFVGGVLPSGVVSFAAGETNKVITVNVQGDTTVEANETFRVNLSNPTNGATITTANAEGIITNDDEEVIPPLPIIPSITLAVSPNSVTEDGAANLVYTFTRPGDATQALTVNYSITGTANSSDYTGATPGTGKTITFTAGSNTAILTIDPIADTTVEPDETVIVTLASGIGYTVGTTGVVTGIITNDDAAIPTIPTDPTIPPSDGLLSSFIRFQNTNQPGTYLFASAGEAAAIRSNPGLRQFAEEGVAFRVALQKTDPLQQAFFRFQNTNLPGTYLFVNEGEAAAIRSNPGLSNFVEEGLAFYAYGSGTGNGTVDFTRFQSVGVPGTYLFTSPGETSSVIGNPNFVREGVAFSAALG
ncbi:hypothetical protein IQ217_06405 [Synechocystis salina LEGE 00031]|uniref:Calx-beta domain-containing protein n=1 Tax=Synechocystis salina LEGE 00031 TaxID=1828736 RepID=A0ABR9VSP1_9SYNC|nr:hypothetical protein [Synechocystis salina LEGE 00041]MBE9253493.1 hypothetical protein [Synechocystis salina LEGE 00031]